MSAYDRCPHCQATGTVEGPNPLLKSVGMPVAILAAAVTLGCFSLTTVLMLFLAPVVGTILIMLIGGLSQIAFADSVCSRCGKAANLAPVRERG